MMKEVGISLTPEVDEMVKNKYSGLVTSIVVVSNPIFFYKYGQRKFRTGGLIEEYIIERTFVVCYNNLINLERGMIIQVKE